LIELRQLSAGLAGMGILVQVHRGRFEEAERLVEVFSALEASD
jgi:hypothetical protein